MENLRTIIVGIVGLGLAALMIVVMATIGLAVVGFAVVVTAIALIASKFSRRPTVQKRDKTRVWNDGRGTIIDM
ncbi:MAG: hypothetical protein AAF724_09735 [Pseudomonadota bacterium]